MQTLAEKKKCDICKSSFNKTNLKKTKHHFHYLEENNYAGTLCTPCNLKLKSPFFLPVARGIVYGPENGYNFSYPVFYGLNPSLYKH